MKLPRETRSLLRHTLSVAEARAVVRAVATGKHAQASVRRTAERLIDQAAAGGEVDVAVHDGTLEVRALRPGRRPFVGVLVVRGDLVVNGLYQDSMDPESVVLVEGDLRAQRLISTGFLEVHGSVKVAREALWLDNDGCGEIFGELRAGFVYSQYHSVRVHQRVVAPLVLGDAQHVRSPKPSTFVCETDEAFKHALLAVLPRAALMIEGEFDDDWNIDAVDSRALKARVVAGRPVLRTAWPPKQR